MMNYIPSFVKETQMSRFDHFRINYELLFRVIEAKDNFKPKLSKLPLSIKTVK